MTTPKRSKTKCVTKYWCGYVENALSPDESCGDTIIMLFTNRAAALRRFVDIRQVQIREVPRAKKKAK
jgi:hypothetical protein